MKKYFRYPQHRCSTPLVLMALACVAFTTDSILLPTNTLAQDETADAKKAEVETLSPTTQILKLKSQLRKEIAELAEEFADAENDEARQTVIDARRDIEKSFVDSLLEVTRERSSTSRNVRDMVWFVNRTKGIARETIYNEMMEKYLDSPDLDDLSKALAKTSKPDEQVEKWLVELIEKSPNEKVKGAATLELVGYLEQVQATLASTDADETSEYLSSRTDEDLTAKIDSLLQVCVEEYADTKYGRSTVGFMAETKIAQMNLQVGRVAPDIVGVDLDDVEFKLSDYRGKVVMIDFWGDW